MSKSSAVQVNHSGWLSPTGLAIPDDTPYEAWVAYGPVLFDLGQSVQWAIGDWSNFGDQHYGEKYAQEIEATGYAYTSIQKFRWVCSKIEFVRRRTNVAFSLHAVVASLEPAEQDAWLDRIEVEGLTRNAVLLELGKAPTNTRQAKPLPQDIGETAKWVAHLVKHPALAEFALTRLDEKLYPTDTPKALVPATRKADVARRCEGLLHKALSTHSHEEADAALMKVRELLGTYDLVAAIKIGER